MVVGQDREMGPVAEEGWQREGEADVGLRDGLGPEGCV